MAQFVMQNLERRLAELENQTYKETCGFSQFKQEKHRKTKLYPYGGPLQRRLSQVYTAAVTAAALIQVCSTKWFSCVY